MARLEDRTLLSADDGFGHDLAHATDIALTGSESGTLTGTLGDRHRGRAVRRRLPDPPDRDGTAVRHGVTPQGPATRLSLLDDQGHVLMQSDGLSPDNRDDQIDLHVPAGTVYLVVEGQGGAGSYTLTTRLTP